MAEIMRITPEETRQKMLMGQAILVCAYDSQEKFAKYHLDGAISLDQFKAQLPGMVKTQEIVFYCH